MTYQQRLAAQHRATKAEQVDKEMITIPRNMFKGLISQIQEYSDNEYVIFYSDNDYHGGDTEISWSINYLKMLSNK